LFCFCFRLSMDFRLIYFLSKQLWSVEVVPQVGFFENWRAEPNLSFSFYVPSRYE
jgi:hypothetical protein